MKMGRRIVFLSLDRQRGAALVTGLIFLVVLTMIGITSARMSGLEERMSGNMRDRSIAMQVAEMALRDAEQDLRGNGTRSPPIAGISGFNSTCTNGLCYNGPNGNSNGVDWVANPIWNSVNMTAAPSVQYGAFTGATAIAAISAQPRYVVEGIRKVSIGGDPETFYYRITVRAQGVSSNSVVWLQEVFAP